MKGARPRLKLVYGNTRTTVHSTKQKKSRGPEGPRPLLSGCGYAGCWIETSGNTTSTSLVE